MCLGRGGPGRPSESGRRRRQTAPFDGVIHVPFPEHGTLHRELSHAPALLDARPLPGNERAKTGEWRGDSGSNGHNALRHDFSHNGRWLASLPGKGAGEKLAEFGISALIQKTKTAQLVPTVSAELQPPAFDPLFRAILPVVVVVQEVGEMAI